jgi:hypothetical protein
MARRGWFRGECRALLLATMSEGLETTVVPVHATTNITESQPLDCLCRSGEASSSNRSVSSLPIQTNTLVCALGAASGIVLYVPGGRHAYNLMYCDNTGCTTYFLDCQTADGDGWRNWYYASTSWHLVMSATCMPRAW